MIFLHDAAASSQHVDDVRKKSKTDDGKEHQNHDVQHVVLFSRWRNECSRVELFMDEGRTFTCFPVFCRFLGPIKLASLSMRTSADTITFSSFYPQQPKKCVFILHITTLESGFVYYTLVTLLIECNRTRYIIGSFKKKLYFYFIWKKNPN